MPSTRSCQRVAPSPFGEMTVTRQPASRSVFASVHTRRSNGTGRSSTRIRQRRRSSRRRTPVGRNGILRADVSFRRPLACSHADPVPRVIISHRHRYLFVEVPRTGSTAVSAELQEHYDGQPILRKHATLRDYLREAGGDVSNYFVFSTVRNPLDVAVTRYVHLRENPRGHFTDPAEIAVRNSIASRLERRVFRWLHRHRRELRGVPAALVRRPVRHVDEPRPQADGPRHALRVAGRRLRDACCAGSGSRPSVRCRPAT